MGRRRRRRRRRRRQFARALLGGACATFTWLHNQGTRANERASEREELGK